MAHDASVDPATYNFAHIAGRKIWYVSMGHMSTNGYQVVVGVLEL
jgi:hypothetical protein